MPDTWYLAVDMQLFLLSPIFIYPLWRWPSKFGLPIVFLGLTAPALYSMIIYLKWDIPLFFLFTRAYNSYLQLYYLLFKAIMIIKFFRSTRHQFSKFVQYMHISTLNRLSSYVVGIVLGWILHWTKNAKIILGKVSILSLEP